MPSTTNHNRHRLVAGLAWMDEDTRTLIDCARRLSQICGSSEVTSGHLIQAATLTFPRVISELIGRSIAAQSLIGENCNEDDLQRPHASPGLVWAVSSLAPQEPITPAQLLKIIIGFDPDAQQTLGTLLLDEGVENVRTRVMLGNEFSEDEVTRLSTLRATFIRTEYRG